MDRLKKVIYKAKKEAFESITPPSSLKSRLEVVFDDENCEVILKLKKKKRSKK